MTGIAKTNHERVARRQVDKFGERRAQLAVATLHTLADLGYARTSLREIAQNSEFSHGVLHYYFSDKLDLITQAVRQYEAVCITRYDDVVARSTSAEQLRRGFSDAMTETLLKDARLHRLWYDLRNQSLFDESFREDVLEIDQRRQGMIWHVLSRYAELSGTTPRLEPGTAYAMLDGTFQRALLRFLAGQTDVGPGLRTDVVTLLDILVGNS